MRKIDDLKLQSCVLSLSQNELEVLNGIFAEMNNAEIAQKLFLSKHTIHTYRNRLLKKFEVNNVAGLTRRCFELKFAIQEFKKTNDLKNLTKREVQILELISLEMSNSKIASVLNLSLNTIATYRKKLFSKLNVNSSVGLVKAAFQNNLLQTTS